MCRVVLVWILLLIAPLPALAAKEPAGQKAILVTGASTGIGRKITERLARDGYFVYAGARKEADLQALSAMLNVQGVRLDVTSDQDIATALETVKQGGRGLYALVNNAAGVATSAPLLETSPQEFDLVMAVNVYGPYRLTRAFAPLIIQDKGRIATIGSIDGIVVRKDIGVYCMSKRAVEAFVDTLAVELEPAGVKVSIIEPGAYNSQIGRSIAKRLGIDDPTWGDRSEYREPDEVAAAVERALFEPRPKRRYMVVPEARQAQITIQKQIAQLVELNEGQPYTYDRATLIRMLDEALAHSRPKTK
jgi:NAD(P)-dependent dehydrogenase (short-subunit alcohol dehydrogenase family)